MHAPSACLDQVIPNIVEAFIVQVTPLIPSALTTCVGTLQVAPSFNDSPASSMASFMQTNNEQNPAQQLVSIVFCSPAKPDSDLAETASLGKSTLLNQYRSCVRTSLLLLGGVECQEKEGTLSMRRSTFFAACDLPL